MDWLPEKVLALAPDDQTAARGKKLAVSSKWSTLASNQQALWGECQGSQATPYQVGVELNGPTYRCTCPSRQSPCKHILGLLLLYATSPELFTETSPPTWLQEWQDTQLSKTIAANSKVITPANHQKKAAAKDKRAAERLARMQEGLAELKVWIFDLLREGIASVEKKDYTFWRDALPQHRPCGQKHLAKRLYLLARCFCPHGRCWGKGRCTHA